MKHYEDVLTIQAKYRAIRALQPCVAMIELVPGVELYLVCNREAHGPKRSTKAKAA